MNPSLHHVFLQTKTVLPVMRSNLVARNRLTDRLNDGTQRRLTSICAPAGFGKTTLLSQWLHQTSLHASWLSLDARDNDMVRFWRYAVQAVASMPSAQPMEHFARLLPLLSSASIDTFLDAFINELHRHEQPIVLIWDDYQYIQHPDIHSSTAYFIDHLPINAHLVIASRSELPFSLVKWTAKSEHLDLPIGQLQFTRDETEAYYKETTLLPLTAIQLNGIFERTEGWVTALQLISISLQTETDYDRLIASFTGGHRAVADFMFQEVLTGLPEDMSRFLLQTAMLGRMDAELCSVITKHPDSRCMLEQLKAQSLFLISLDEHNEWFRYHHLFAEFLQNRLKQLHPDLWIAYNHAASISLAERGFIVEALDHALAAHDSALTEKLLEKHAPALLMQGEFSSLLRWLDFFPQTTAGRAQETSLLHAFVLIVNGQPDRAEEMLAHIEQQPEAAHDQQMQSGLLFVKSNLLFSSGRFEQWLAFASKGLDDMLPHSSIYYNFNYNLTEPLVRRTSFGMNGTLTADTEQIAKLFTSTLKAHNWNESLINLYVMQSLCEGYYEWNRLKEAEALLGVIDRAARLSKTFGLFVPNRITQAMAYMAQGLSYLAHDTIDEAMQFALLEQASLHWKQALIACKIRLHLLDGSISLAKKELPKLQISMKEKPVFNRYFEYVLLARLLGAQRKETEALRIVSYLKPQAMREGHLVSTVELTILEACLMDQLGRRKNALDTLHEALALTEPFGYLRSYTDEGERMRTLLQRYMNHREHSPEASPPGSVSEDYVQRLLQAFPARGAKASADSRLEELSRSELQLLQLIRQGASNKTIAQTLMLSEGTVKVYLSRIYVKLGVSSRTQALLAAEELQLLKEE
ncbi:LuxR family maltose regulon positive regulatory protein [Paenibacillus endophyticus]|uniref:LuxR family maltose regulon positive regulatory protein n=1 Tax=Paenibacillus endophyticus TaxID=1294268 RepID=A0A7W5C732_9BACL|nr:LuxR C-terminal-related transcriptional regulator [Paenibacillus endophyticus]MBB3152371.1 LuxR family maltose regulon positive regulatory protein [Paenibacillus endophyticus]